MSRIQTYRSFFLVFIVWWSAVGFSQTKTDSVHYSHSEMNSLSTKTLYVRSNPATSSSCSFTIKKAELKAYLYMGDTYTHGSNAFTGNVTLKVDAYTSFSGATGLYDTWWIKLAVNEGKPEEIYLRDFTAEHGTINRFEVKVAAYTAPGTGPPNFNNSIQAAVFFDEEFGVDVKNVTLLNVAPATATVTANPVTFTWKRCGASCSGTGHCKEVPNYLFQLLRLYNTSPGKTTETDINALVDWDKALTIETNSADTTLTLAITEGQGFYVWRVCPVGTNYEGGIADSRNWKWLSGSSFEPHWSATTYADESSWNFTPSASVEKFYYTQFDDTLNWIYSRTFSEGDPISPQVRMSEKITYANGLQQVKQNQAHLFSEKQVLVNQTIYDWSGRAAVNTLPAPLTWDTDTLKYRTKAIKVGSNIYSATHFDENNNYNNPTASDGGFIHSYYSNSNTDTLVPNGEGYPFSRALYERDGTGRVKEQGGPGETHRIKTVNARTTRTFYGGVSNKELLRIFGDEAPDPTSVHKVVNVDANSVTTVSYVGKEGQTIATCLAIVDSLMLDTLPSQAGARFTVNDTIKGNQPYGNYGIMSAKPLVLATPTTVTFSYRITAKDIKHLCMNYCKNCDYTIEFLIKSDSYTSKVTKLITAANCTSPKPKWDTTFVRSSLPAGSYVIEKRVYANNVKPNSATDSTSAYTYLEEHQKNLRKQLQDTADKKLDSVYYYLNRNDLYKLYNYELGINTNNISNPDSVFADSVKIWNIGCGNINIPILFCKGYDCSDNTPDFEAHFNKRWAGTHYVGTSSGYLKWLPMDTTGGKTKIGFKPGEFNWMIKNMVDTTYNCQNLWKCWDRVVQSYAVLDTLSDTSNYELDVLREFLNCTGTMYKGYANKYPSDTAKWRGKAYKWFFYYKGKSANCDSAIKAAPPVGQGATSGWGEDPLNGQPSTQKWRNYRDCVEKLQSPSTQTPASGTATAKCGCEGVCEDRYESFKLAQVMMYHNDSIYVEGDKYYLKRDTTWGQKFSFDTTKLPGGFSNYIPMTRIECAARSLVENCKKYCQLTTYTTGGHVDSVGNPTEKANIEKAMTWSFELKRPACGSGWDTIKPLSTGGDTSFVKLWERDYGGTGAEELWDIAEAKYDCGGYLMVGFTNTNGTNNDVSDAYCSGTQNKEWWLLRVGPNGDKMWDKSFGGSGDDELRSVIQTKDGGWLLGGYSASGIACEKTQGTQGGDDYWLIKTDAVGTILWDKRYGGSATDRGESVWENSDGTILFGGYSNSGISGDKTDTLFGSPDWWILKLDNKGTKLWDYTFGTTAEDYLYSVRQAKDGNYMLAGVKGTNGNDGWFMKLNTSGNKIWDKTFSGGSSTCSQKIYAMEPVIYQADSGYVLAGTTQYQACGTSAPSPCGNTDYWMLRTDKNGDTLWTKKFGGSGVDNGVERSMDIKQTKDKGYIIGGSSATYSVSCNKTATAQGAADYWVVRTDSMGTKKYDRVFGGDQNDYFTSMSVDSIGYFLLAGYSNSGATGNKSTSNYGSSDYWVLRGRDWCRHDTLCFKWVQYLATQPDSIKTFYNPISCDSVSSASIKASILQQVENYIKVELDNFKTKYFLTCAVADSIKDTFALAYNLGLHHFTLYMYDRAGNLVSTVPPAGVAYYTDNHRMNTTSHTLKTKYKYNSLKQLSEQETPDGGKTEFWYDYKGQLRFSRNAKQKPVNKYSYTKYDNLGRIIEVGESSKDGSTTFMDSVNKVTYPGSSNSQRVYTVYTTPATNIWFIGMKTQRYLQNRVSYTYTEDNIYSYYSYSPHGEVEWLIQDIPGLGKQYIGYEYDLISNKVLKVKYNESGVDEFYHRYFYDEDQRIKKAETGWGNTLSNSYTQVTGAKRKGLGWDKDGNYKYYKHGPLKRMEIGEDKIQGVDYVYTLQGWLKAINHPSLTVADDPGKDNDNTFCRDAFGMALGYHPNDFNRTNSKYNPGTSTLVSSNGGISNLFNGNISNWTLQTDTINGNFSMQMGMKYRYDQLNRIKTEDYNEYSSGAWSNPANTLDNTYTFDGNGKILTMTRKGTSNDRDVLTANYYANTNRLEYVDDAANAGNYSVDIDDQSAGNYKYTAIGERAKDTEGGIDTITWTVYGKMKTLKRSNGDSLIFTYDAMNHRVMKRKKLSSGTETITYFVRDAQGNIMSIYERTTSGSNYIYTQKEVPLYGSSMIGSYKPNITVKTLPATGCGPCGSPCSCIGGSGCVVHQWTINIPKSNGYYSRNINKKEYELKDHLGNVRITLTDRKNANGTANLVSYTNYYAFGTELTGKTYSSNSYSFGYNGKWKDDDVFNVSGGFYEYEERGYDAKGIPNFLTSDKIIKPYESSYIFAANNPILYIDLNGGDNYIYLIISNEGLKALGVKDAKEIETKTNQILSDMGVETRVKLYNSNEPFDPNNLDPNDSYAVIDTKENLSKQFKENPDNLPANPYKLSSSEPEISKVGDYMEGKVAPGIMMGAKEINELSKTLKSDPATTGAMIVVHGAVHNAGIKLHVEGTLAGSGAEIVNKVTGDQTAGDGREFQKLPAGKTITVDQLIKGSKTKLKPVLEKSFGTTKAVDNYENKKAKSK